MDFFDTHLHLSEIPDPAEYVVSANAAGVKYLLACGGDAEDSEIARIFSEQFPNCFFAAGVHPHTAESYDGNARTFQYLCGSPKCLAVGEIGIDTFYSISNLEYQKKAFQDMLDVALDLNLPAIVHCRAKDGESDAYDICLELLTVFSKRGGRFVVHCYTGTMENLHRFSELGAYFGVGGMITFRKADNVRALAAAMPEDRILLETDAPYLAPIPYRGKRNESKYIPLIAEKLAEVRLTTAESIARLTTENAFRLFGLNGVPHE